MSPSSFRQKDAMRVHFFDPRILTSVEDIVHALHEFENTINETNFVSHLEPFLAQPPILALILSGVSDAKPLTLWIMKQFPANPKLLDDSFAWKLVSRLCDFFQFHALPLSGELRELVASPDRYRLVTTAPKTLSMLSAMTFEDQEDKDGFPPAKHKGKHQKRMKHGSRRTTAKKPMDLKVIEDHLESVPSSQADADSAMMAVLHSLKTSLECYFEALRLPAVGEAIQMEFIPREELLSSSTVESKMADAMSKELLRIEIPSAYPMVQPLKSAQHFSSAEGFGEWRILISTRADQDLREARRKDSKTFKIIVKKIKELSNGHFSDDNQKKLTSHSTDVPVFEAKMTRDSRLVYQIDSVSDYNSDREQQVIRIFGIYTHAQLNNRLWNSVGRQLGKRGKEYKRRCLYRKRPLNSGDNVFSPASFPPLEENETSLSGIGSDLPPDDLDQIHSLLVLEKYLTFSQELLKSMIADLDVAFPFQVSPQEREIIDYPYSCYVLGRSGTGKTTTMLFKMLWIERAFQLNSNNMPKPRQVFVTKSRVLAGKVEEYFLKLSDSLKASSQSPQELQKVIQARKMQLDEDNLVDTDDEDDWRGDLPSRFSELVDSHFPLFITFERLCDLIEADFDPCDRIQYVKDNMASRGMVTYEKFLYQYWPHFSQPLTKGLDPSLVFSEIIGIILGSEETTASALGYLDRRTYESLSERTQSTFASQRSVVYTIFELYKAQKCQRGEFDAGDRTHNILRVLANSGVPGRKIDQLCVDEAQDNLLIDALLLRYLCHNTDGLFWAGDTAQTISIGSSFRFDDLKAFLYRIEKCRLETRSLTETVFRAQKSPKTFQLATNYRSHAGIVNCAHSVIELIMRFWPYSIDSLAPEKGIVEGLKPVFLDGWDSDNVRYEQFLFGSSGSHIEFGAQQCILVRNEGARQKLQEQIGDIGLIMTLYESKGLEFNDVLLFNFFEDSTVDLSQWRIILAAVDSAALVQATAAPQFDEIRHAGVCAELKFLYVAITRARKNLWIADQSTKGEPMRTFWTTRDQVYNCTPDTDMPRLAVSSSAEEWASKGKELFERKRFLQAKHCYERASKPREMAVSHAYFLREEARKEPSGYTRRVKEQRYSSFRRAAESFLSCAQEANKHRTVYFRRAGECFESAAEDLRAANAYLEARDFNIAAKLFRKLGLFDEAVSIIEDNGDHMQSEVVESIRHVARLHYFREKKFQQARGLFSSDEEELEYLEDLDLDIARIEVLLSLGRRAEAAELHLSEGRVMDAIPLFLEDTSNQHSMRQASSSILQQFWGSLSFGIAPVQSRSISLLLEWSSSLNVELLESQDRDEISMFKAILSCDRSELVRMAKGFLNANNRPAAILCLDHLFVTFPNTKMLLIEDLTKILELFLVYVRLLDQLAFQVDPRTTPSIAKLFGFSRSSGDDFLLPVGTFMHQNLMKTHPTSLKFAPTEISIPGWDLWRHFRRLICDRLRERIIEQNEICKRSPQLSSCLTFVTFAYCNRVECPYEHTSPSALTVHWYNARIRVHLQQMLIVQTLLHTVESISDMNRQKRHWLNRFYNALNPPFHVLGTKACLNAELIPEFQKGIQVVKDWIRELAYTLSFGLTQTKFLTNLLSGAFLGYTFDKKEASDYLCHSQYLRFAVPPGQYLRPPDNEYMLPELLESLKGSKIWSISAGILSLRHILHAKLQISITILCDFIEFLCASLVISHWAARNGSLHGVTLPHSWLVWELTDPKPATPKATNCIPILVDTLGTLLEVIYTGVGAEFLLFENHNLARIPGVRGVFISRICRALCLLGYNIRKVPLQSSIVKAITALRQVERKFPGLYRQQSKYVYARHWKDLTRELCDPCQGLLQDGLLQLHDLRQDAVPRCPLHGVKLIAYKTDDDLLGFLHSFAFPAASPSLAIPETFSDGVEHSTVIDQERNMEKDDDSKDPGDDKSELPDEFEDLDAHDGGINSSETLAPSDIAFSMPSDMPQTQAPSDTENLAASKIQKAYKRTLLRRRQMAKAALAAARSRFFSLCLEQAQNLSWKQGSHYRLLFLGPLPHLLVSLDIARAAAHSQKTVAKKQLLSNRHEELEELSLRLTNLGKINKAILRSQKALEPTAHIHSRCNHDELRRCVQEAADVLLNLPFKTREDFRGDLDIAIRGIVTRRQQKAAPKPSLVWDEEV